jgi:hypothetical protein
MEVVFSVGSMLRLYSSSENLAAETESLACSLQAVSSEGDGQLGSDVVVRQSHPREEACVMRQSPANKDVNLEAEEPMTWGVISRQPPVKTQ